MSVKPRDFRNLPVCREGTYTRAVAGGQHVSLVSHHRGTLATTTPRGACRDCQIEYSSVATTNVIPILRSPPVCPAKSVTHRGLHVAGPCFMFHAEGVRGAIELGPLVSHTTAVAFAMIFNLGFSRGYGMGVS
ncbi:unnamed protein product [Ectocarpus sp. 12 AP-2014]